MREICSACERENKTHTDKEREFCKARGALTIQEFDTGAEAEAYFRVKTGERDPR